MRGPVTSPGRIQEVKKMIYKMQYINHNLPQLLELTDTMPAEYRNWDSDIYGYHITSTDNIDSIKQNGIYSNSSRQSYDRPECVYLFLDHEIDSDNVKILLGNVDNFAIVTVKFPASEVKKMRFDGLYNISFDCGYSAIQYFDNVPAEYIVNIDILK
jgi:hypothetical protein